MRKVSVYDESFLLKGVEFIEKGHTFKEASDLCEDSTETPSIEKEDKRR